MKAKKTMKSLITLCSFLLLTTALTAGSDFSKNQTTTIGSEEILQRNREMEAALRANDMMKLASFYSDSGMIIGNNILIKGREGIDAYWMNIKDRGVDWELESIKIDICDGLAVQQGISKLTFLLHKEPYISIVRFTLVWKKIDGKWLIEIDHYSKF